MGKYFGTDGFRGEANVVLTVEHAFKIGRFLGWYYGKERPAKIVIGKDTRRSSYMFEYSLAAGITASGADAYLLHVTTTPSVAYVARTEGFDCGIMISASHNVYFDNGIKLISSEGKKMSAEVEEMIEKYIDGEMGEIPFATRDRIGRSVDHEQGRDRYIEFLAQIPEYVPRKMKFVLDCSNGSASNLAWKVYEKVGLRPELIFNEPTGFNINNGCGSTDVAKLQEYVKEHGLDCGFAYDGDADRCIAVDEDGEIVDGDKILFICGKYLKEKGRLHDDTVVSTVMSNLGYYKSLEREGIKSEQTDVGDKYVSENMFANGYSLGGEQSGHIIFSDFATTGDGILTSLMVVEAIAAKNRSLKSLASECDIYPQLLKNVVVKDKIAAMQHPAVLAAVEKVKEELGDEGRILVRKSGTEPKVRVMVEAKDDALCSKYVEEVIKVIKDNNLEA